MHIENRGVCVSLAFEVGEGLSISSQKNVTLRTIYTLKTQTQNKQAFQQSHSHMKKTYKVANKSNKELGIAIWAWVGQISV